MSRLHRRVNGATPPRPHWRVLLLAALTAVLALLLPAAPASAAPLPAAETRFGASTLATPDVVGVHECITAGQRPVRGPSQLQIVVGNCVAAEDVPTVVFSRSRAPGIADNFDNAVADGAPTRLSRVDDAARRANRRDALRGQPRAPAGQSLDEYPFACSAQGGCGATVSAVPVGEQSYQGGVLSQFFQRSGVQPGVPFDVMFGP